MTFRFIDRGFVGVVHLSYPAAAMKVKKVKKNTSIKAKEGLPKSITSATKEKKIGKALVGKGAKKPSPEATAIEAEEVEKSRNGDPAQGAEKPLPEGRSAIMRKHVKRMRV